MQEFNVVGGSTAQMGLGNFWQGHLHRPLQRGRYSYKVYRCWSPSTKRPDLDANANAVAPEHVKVENGLEGSTTASPSPREPESAEVTMRALDARDML